MRKHSFVLARAFAVLALIVLAACGGGSKGPTGPDQPGPPPSPPSPARISLFESREFIANPGPGGVGFIRQTDVAGRVEAIMTWTPKPPAGEGGIQVWRYAPGVPLTSECWEAEPGRCYLNPVVAMAPLGVEPRTLQFQAAAGDRYAFHFQNIGKVGQGQDIHGFASAYLYPSASATGQTVSAQVFLVEDPVPEEMIVWTNIPR